MQPPTGSPTGHFTGSILELLLFGVIPRKDTKPIAKALLAKFGNFSEVLAASPEALMSVDGIKDSTAAMLKAVQASVQLSLQTRIRNADVISSWSALVDYCTARMALEPTEQFRLIYLDRKNKVIADEPQQKGTVDHTPVYPREVVKRALDLNASALILVHNHPSGDRSMTGCRAGNAIILPQLSVPEVANGM